MITLLEFIARISLFLYILMAFGILLALREIFRARRNHRLSTFSLEREDAQQAQRRSTSSLIILLLLLLVVYVVNNIVVPNLSNQETDQTPTPVVFLTPQLTATESALLYPTITPTVGVPPAEVTPQQATLEGGEIACQIVGATLTNPEPGQNVSGQAAVEGEANILDFAQYKFEISGSGTGDAWVVVGTYFTPVSSGFLGNWDTTSLLPGTYTFRLVVSRSNGSFIEPCEVPIVIVQR